MSDRKPRMASKRWLSEVEDEPVVSQPCLALVLGVLQASISDYRILQRAGLIVDGVVQERAWPRQRSGQSYRHFCGLDGPLAAKNLIEFFRAGDWDALAAIAGFNVSGAEVCRELGITEK